MEEGISMARSFGLYLIGILVIYIIGRLIILLIDYLLFKKLLSSIVDAIIIEEDTESDYRKMINIDHQDSILFEKNLNKEKQVERIDDIENPDFQKNKFQKRIVGISLEKKIFGKWTKLVVGRMANKLRELDPNDFKNGVGINEQMEKQKRGKSDNSIGL